MDNRLTAAKRRSIARAEGFCRSGGSTSTNAVVEHDRLFLGRGRSQALVRERKMMFQGVSDSDMVRSRSVLTSGLMLERNKCSIFRGSALCERDGSGVDVNGNS